MKRLMSLSQPTAPLLNLPVPPRRSSWILRLLFAFLALGILAIGSLAAVVIGRTVWALAGPGRPAAEAEPQPDRPQAPADDAPVADAPEAAVWDQHGPLDILLMGLDIDDCEQGSELATASEAGCPTAVVIPP